MPTDALESSCAAQSRRGLRRFLLPQSPSNSDKERGGSLLFLVWRSQVTIEFLSNDDRVAQGFKRFAAAGFLPNANGMPRADCIYGDYK